EGGYGGGRPREGGYGGGRPREGGYGGRPRFGGGRPPQRDGDRRFGGRPQRDGERRFGGRPQRRDAHDPDRVSLPRAIARLGYTSRNLAIELIQQGRVKVDTRNVTNPSVRVLLNRNKIYVDDICINTRHARTYIVMHKPKGLVTSREDNLGRKTIYSVLPSKQEWVFPVGRLDKNTSGLLILTNDGVLANYLTSPLNNVEKAYVAKLNKKIEPADLKKIEKGGIEIEPGVITKPAKARIFRENKKTCWLEVTLSEGKNRQVRKMLKALGYEVITLVRTRVSKLELGNLPIGSWRELTTEEVTSLYNDELPERFATPPTEDEEKIASGELEPPKKEKHGSRIKAKKEAANAAPASDATAATA
ncbi:MAG TPA: pseudouridine synthase, partial [Candidatus Kapabacteria bacterium]|nr:pseudouridine synthase [Candidatus Kapabacteria bacterium]